MTDRPSLRIRTATALLGLYWIALFAATHVPMHSQGSGHNLDKVFHFAAYAGLTFLLALVVHRARRFNPISLLVILAVVGAYGAVDEWIQTFIPTRNGDLMDWLADISGASLGLAAFAISAAIRGDTAKTSGS